MIVGLLQEAADDICTYIYTQGGSVKNKITVKMKTSREQLVLGLAWVGLVVW